MTGGDRPERARGARKSLRGGARAGRNGPPPDPQRLPDYFEFADGSALIEMGKTRVLGLRHDRREGPPVPQELGNGLGHRRIRHAPLRDRTRTPRERTPGRSPAGRQEIQRLIGRALRTVTDLSPLGERTILVDCDVLQADGGTRVASVTAGCVALALALKKMLDRRLVEAMPLKHLVAGVSVGLVGGRRSWTSITARIRRPTRHERRRRRTGGQLIEVQAAAEKSPFSRNDLAEA